MNTQTAEHIKTKNKEELTSALILFNDEVNTFDYVIEQLIEFCHHDELQAEQCALIAHFNNQCIIKQGKFTDIKKLFGILSDKGLTLEIKY
ncbi:MAG: ATP-dependent Clp protease adaptor ClpS [Flavobacteriales bacterium]|nr:ATP-dependent Clp protease adaptor ClpS [Flavobacteriales bacterium]